MKIIGCAKCTLLILAMTLAGRVGAEAHGWPVQPSDQEHPIGNTLGEFQALKEVARVYQHIGIDILATPYPDPTAPYVVVTVAGQVVFMDDAAGTKYNSGEIVGEDGNRYRYMHLAYLSFDAGFVNAYNAINPADKMVPGGALIARVHPWGCSYDHLHYDVIAGGNRYLNPLTDITPNPDGFAPQVLDVRFADHDLNRWFEFVPPLGPACTVVNGEVDIVAQLLDRDDAGSTLIGAGNVGVHNLRWRVCPTSAFPCDAWNDTHQFKEMPTAWGSPGNPDTRAQFSTSPDWVSTYKINTVDELFAPNVCPATADDTFMVPTSNVTSGWNTVGIPNGNYSVSVEASDIAGNVGTRTVHACVQNAAGCATDLSIRDGVNDTGATPYSDSPSWLSPDITVNAGTLDENKNVKEGAANVIEVKVQNTGSCTLPVGTAYTVCLGWDAPSGSVPFPLPTNHTISCKPQTVSVSGWQPGSSRPTTFTWTPAIGSVPAGHSCLVAWTDMTADPVQTTPSVVLDNNRAQRNIMFTPAPQVGAMSLQPFWINPLDAVTERSLEIKFRSSSAIPYLATARIHVPPGVTVAQLFDTAIVGGYRGSMPAELCPRGDETSCVSHCNSWAEAAASGCTLVLGRIGPQSRVRLEGISVSAPTKLLLEVSTRERVPPGAFFDARIVEYGTIDHSPHTAIGGVTLRFEGSVPR